MADAKRDPVEWLRQYDGSPVADVPANAAYRVETSDDGGATWEYPRATTGEHLKLDVADALYGGLAVEIRDDVVTFPSPHPIGGLIRYTPTH
ncbi:hypothetical protein [Streptomyces sp. NPDC058266]|uniref:hypothetical protein n=1 Tax=Streptomyces sp. NPDC058266 TaxID=3346412 RepID=UPI0036EBAA0E